MTMASSNIKLFDENKGNMLSDSEFSISNQRLNGLQTGVASSQLQNKAMYQASLVAYAIAQVMMQNGKDANDTDAVSTFVANLSGTMLQKVYDLASTEEAQAGVATGKWMSPALVKAAIDTLAAKAQNVLSDTTKALYGLDSSSVPNDVFVEIMRQLSEKVNPNLFDNWYFGNPVNQRGVTTTTGDDEYFIDRWMGYFAGVSISSGAITFSNNNGIGQKLEDTLADYIAGKKCTISAIVNGSLYSATKVLTSGYMAFNLGDSGIRMDLNLGSSSNLVLFYNVSGENRAISAVKLELGSQQTLAHVENGSWVLNEIPNYGDTFIECKRYFQRTGQGFIGAYATNTRIYISGRFDVEMRTEPTVTLTTKTPLFYDYGSDVNISNASIVSSKILKSGAAYIGIDHDYMSASGKPITMGDNYLDFSADL